MNFLKVSVLILYLLIRCTEMRQAWVQFECISNNDDPFNNIETFICKPSQRSEYQFSISLLLNVTTSHDGNLQVGVVDEQLTIMIMSWSRELKCAGLILISYWGWKVETYTKKNEFFPTFELTTKYLILRYILSFMNDIYR